MGAGRPSARGSAAVGAEELMVYALLAGEWQQRRRAWCGGAGCTQVIAHRDI